MTSRALSAAGAQFKQEAEEQVEQSCPEQKPLEKWEVSPFQSLNSQSTKPRHGHDVFHEQHF
jgi:hypothetical protein